MRGSTILGIVATAAALAVATPAAAGPWPREAGRTFLAFGQTLPVGSGAVGETTVFGEYGLGGGWTLGLDAGAGHTGRDRAALFLRRSYAAGPHRLAWEIGVGVATAPGTTEIALRPGASWGMGMQRPMAGWVSVDLRGDLRATRRAAKLEATVGIKPTARLMGMLQLQVDAAEGAPTTVYLAPAAAWELRPGVQMELGVRAGLTGYGDNAVRLGTWISF